MARRRGFETPHEALPGRLRLERGVEWERPWREPVAAASTRFAARDPAMAVGEPPGHDEVHRGLGERRVEKAGVFVGDEPVARGEVAGRRRIRDVEFGDRDPEAEPGHLREEIAQARRRERKAVDFEVRLHPERLDRHARTKQPLEKPEQRNSLRLPLRCSEVSYVMPYSLRSSRAAGSASRAAAKASSI
jgi:hypothetical protein